MFSHQKIFSIKNNDTLYSAKFPIQFDTTPEANTQPFIHIQSTPYTIINHKNCNK